MTLNNAGSYFWIASYSGDANNDPVSGACGDAGETSVVATASPAISTSATNATAGGSVSDTATLSGGTAPTGTITFQLFSDSDCTNQVGGDDVVTVDGNGDYTSAAVTLNNAGSYFWIASYSGDANNDPVSGACGDAGETSVVATASPAISTSATNATAGGSVSDTATLSGGTAPTGTITFQLFSDDQCTNQVGGDDVVTVDGNGDYTSAAVTLNNAGSYFWIASYSGDANNDPVSGACGDAGETSVVATASPAISTSATNATAGGSVSDTATLSGGTAPTGTITFQLFSDDQCTNQVGGDDVVTVDGNGDYTSAAVTLNNAGSYFWIASYSGDANNDPVSGACGDAGETSVVATASPAISTSATNATAGGSVSDTATLSGGTAPTGTITFQLFSDDQLHEPGRRRRRRHGRRQRRLHERRRDPEQRRQLLLDRLLLGRRQQRPGQRRLRRRRRDLGGRHGLAGDLDQRHQRDRRRQRL